MCCGRFRPVGTLSLLHTQTLSLSFFLSLYFHFIFSWSNRSKTNCTSRADSNKKEIEMKKHPPPSLSEEREIYFDKVGQMQASTVWDMCRTLGINFVFESVPKRQATQMAPFFFFLLFLNKILFDFFSCLSKWREKTLGTGINSLIKEISHLSFLLSAVGFMSKQIDQQAKGIPSSSHQLGQSFYHFYLGGERRMELSFFCLIWPGAEMVVYI